MSEERSWFRIGHVTHEADRTGCTVILFDDLTPSAVDVRGGAPGTREISLLDDGMLIGCADAILLTGGSAFGLAAADGVMSFLQERGRGVKTSAGAVPIVPAAVIFDRGVGSATQPSADDGYRAADLAGDDNPTTGRVGAGTGATVAKLGTRPGVDSGIGFGFVETRMGRVSAVVVLNAVGDVIHPQTGRWLARTSDPDELGRSGRELVLAGIAASRDGENTTIGAILLDAEVDRKTLLRCCVSAHAALARCVIPSHTIFDGDTMFAAGRSFGAVEALDVLTLACATELAVERAIVGIFADAKSPVDG